MVSQIWNTIHMFALRRSAGDQMIYDVNGIEI